MLASRWHGQSARAQQAAGARRIGVLLPYADNDPEAQSHLSAITQELKRLGWSQDRNIRIDACFAAGIADQYPLLAKELAALQPDVMLSESTPAAAALKQETRSIPIVFVGVSDPVGSGFVTSLARPGGDLTGMMQYESGITGKWLAMLKEVAPRLARVAFVANPKFRGRRFVAPGRVALCYSQIHARPAKTSSGSTVWQPTGPYRRLLARCPSYDGKRRAQHVGARPARPCHL